MSGKITSGIHAADNGQLDDLFLNLAEQVKLPFVQIKHAAQLMEGIADPNGLEQSRHSIELASNAALSLIDGYLLSVRMQREQQLELEPVSVSAVLYDTAASLQEYARAHNCKLEIQLAGKYAPVMAHRAAVQAALTSLGYSFIEALSNGQSEHTVHLALRKGNGGITTGVFSDQSGMSSALLRQARALKGKVHQPMAQFDSGNGSGIFIADALFYQMNTLMKVSRLRGMQGLAATLSPSRQLSLV